MKKEKELRQWLKDKKVKPMFRYMCYASIAFGLQRDSMHRMYKKLKELDSDIFYKLSLYK